MAIQVFARRPSVQRKRAKLAGNWATGVNWADPLRVPYTALYRIVRELGLAELGSIIFPSASMFGLVERFRRRIWLSRFFILAIRGGNAHFEELCAEIGQFRNFGVNLGGFSASLAFFVNGSGFLDMFSSRFVGSLLILMGCASRTVFSRTSVSERHRGTPQVHHLQYRG